MQEGCILIPYELMWCVQVLVRLRQILRVTRIFRLMRVLKLFQQYLVCPCNTHCSLAPPRFQQGV